MKCVWYWLLTGIHWKLLWYCSPRNCYRGISVLYVLRKSLWFAHIWELHRFHINSKVYYCAINSNSNMRLKIFYSHDSLYGKGQPQGSCVFLKVPSLDSLVHYFQGIRNNDIFEVRGVQNSLNETINFNLSWVVAPYSLCHSIMKPCNYWNYNSSLPTIVDNGKKICRK